MLFNLQDKVTVNMMPKLTSRINICQKLLLAVMLPLNILWCSFLTVVCLPKENNGFKNKQISNQLTSRKQVCISKDIPQELIKRKARQMGGTLNDVLMTILSVSINKYLKAYTNDTTTETIQLAVPFSLRPTPKSPMDFSFNNQFAILPLRLRLVNSFNEGF